MMTSKKKLLISLFLLFCSTSYAQDNTGAIKLETTPLAAEGPLSLEELAPLHAEVKAGNVPSNTQQNYNDAS